MEDPLQKQITIQTFVDSNKTSVMREDILEESVVRDSILLQQFSEVQQSTD